MDVHAYKDLYNSYEAYNDSLENNYGNIVTDLPPNRPELPITVFSEVRNVATAFNSCFGKVASVGYRVDIFAQDKGEISRIDIAREIAQQADEFFTALGLQCTSFNANALYDEGGTYRIMLVYSGNLDESRRRFI